MNQSLLRNAVIYSTIFDLDQVETFLLWFLVLDPHYGTMRWEQNF